MTGARWSSGRRRAAVLAAVAAAGGAAALLAAAPAVSESDTTKGRLTSEAVSGPACTSPTGFCTRGTLKGDLKGTFEFVASSVTATVDTPTTSVVVYTGDLVISTRDGTLTCKDAGALQTTGDRDVASVCTVVAGTGGHQATTGRLRISGIAPDFSGGPGAAGGAADYEGTLTR